MRHYPYFFMDLVLLLLLLIIVPAGALLMQPPSLATAAASVIIFALFFKMTIEKIQDFRSSVKNIDGIDSWESDFMSLGTLLFKFKGEQMSYKSELKGRNKEFISVHYCLSSKNDSKTEFAIINQEKGWLGEFAVFGNSEFLESVKKQISEFNKKYCIVSLSNTGGVLESVVELSFKSGQPPSKETKLDEMQAFLNAFLDFQMKLNQRLKKGPKTSNKKTPTKTTKKRRKRKK